MNKDILDKRFNLTKNYLANNKGRPIYKRKCFSFINNVLGPQYKWINKSPSEYFNSSLELEAIQAIKILNFKGVETFKEVRNNYIKMSKEWHPDCGGHSSAFDILNYAYNLFKTIYEEEDSNRPF
jgi:hypothetical protein